jgi:NTP pyrophosphatase (non-canonical NTP hydrolase)
MKLNPWQPETNKVNLAVLGKLLEELGELTAIVSRCIIQGIDEQEPTTKISNKVALQNELADVEAGLFVATIHFNLDYQTIAIRRARKIEHKLEWHKLIT